ncbi:MAG TPA: dihydrodipicolinate synthase family protein [Actinoplanes sp.]|jgi:4-hydroxy-tetrahydrodipicolinate synthase
MNRDDVDWRGYLPSFITPFFADGALDLDTARALVEFYVGQGMHGIAVNGTVGEWFSQSVRERRAMAEATLDQARGRFTVLIGCTSYTADQVIDLAGHAFAHGADGVLVSPPPYAKLFPDEIIAWYEDISAGVDGPVVVYNWPHGSGVDIGTDLADRLADIDKVVAIKDSTPNTEQFFATSRRVRDRVRVFGPYMSVAGVAELEQHGGDGFVGGGSLRGHADPAFWESVWAGDFAAARAYAVAADRLFPQLWQPGGWAGVHGAYQSELKVIMRLLGQPSGHVRRPRLPITDPSAIEEIRAVLVAEGLLAGAPA